MNGCVSHDLLVDPKEAGKTIVYCTRKHQPIDMGIIADTKLHYRGRFLGDRVSAMAVADTLWTYAKFCKMAAGTAGSAEAHPTHLLYAAKLQEAALGSISKDSITCEVIISSRNDMSCVQVRVFT